MTAVVALAKLQFKLIARDPGFLVVIAIMPLAIMPVARQLMALSLTAEGFVDANGAEQVVPGQVILFSFFISGSVGFSMYREHGWRTWDRLRTASSSSRTLLYGFGAPWLVVHMTYQVIVFSFGLAILGVSVTLRQILSIALVMIAYASATVCLILFISSVLKSVNQLNAFQNIGAMLFAGVSGALVPIEQLPAIVRAIAPATPAFWAMSSYRSVLLEGSSPSSVFRTTAILLSFTVLFAAGAVVRFRADEKKTYFS